MANATTRVIDGASPMFNRELAAACSRMDRIASRIYWEATQKPGAVISRGSFCENGPVCLRVTIEGRYVASVQEAKYDEFSASRGIC